MVGVGCGECPLPEGKTLEAASQRNDAHERVNAGWRDFRRVPAMPK